MKRYFVLVYLLMATVAKADVDDRVCLALDGPAELQFEITSGDEFFNCLQIKSYGSSNNLKVTTLSSGMAHNVNVYSSSGDLEDRLQVGIQEFDKANFSNFSTNTTKIIDLEPVTIGALKVSVAVSYFKEVDGTHVLIVSSRLRELEQTSGPTDPIEPPQCPPGEICFDPQSTPVGLSQTVLTCDASNTPPTHTEMGLEDQGLNQYLEHLENVGRQSGYMEALRYVYTHFSEPAQNPKALPGGTEYGGNFRYGAGAVTILDAAGYGNGISSYITFAGSAFQGASSDLDILLNNNGQNVNDWYEDRQIMQLSIYAGLAHFENKDDQSAIQEGINYYQQIYKNDSDKNSVKDSCSREPASTQNEPSAVGGGGSGGYAFFSPLIIGGQIQFPQYGSICDPGEDCFRDHEGEVEPN